MNDERKAFEAWAEKDLLITKIGEDYVYRNVEIAWQAWQAARATPQEPVAWRKPLKAPIREPHAEQFTYYQYVHRQPPPKSEAAWEPLYPAPPSDPLAEKVRELREKGWKLLPPDASENAEMLKAGAREINNDEMNVPTKVADVYWRMFSASPDPLEGMK